MASSRTLNVYTLSRAKRRGVVEVCGMRMPCALGRGGIRQRKREGDGGTPAGRWRLVRVLYRPDRRMRPSTGLPVRTIRANDGWCDAPGDRNYNRAVRLPYPASHENMARDDGLYDLVVVLDHNMRPRRRGAGSAIFMHVARPGYLPTEGCIALKAADLERLLARLGRVARIVVP
jgi:L,D-peptidoglycan transpeptidase YkuD (ErfK/YbiS/YcfS/YnhG family)